MEEATAGERKRLREGDAVTSAAAAAARDPQYTYLSIADALKVPGVRVCILAVVSEIGTAVRSRGTVFADFTLTLRIVDQSRPAGISATFFAEDTALLPCVKSSGDVISLHNVTITMHGEFFVTFNKKFSSFALFESKVFAECSPYQSSMKYRGRIDDKELLTQQRTWLAYNLLGLKDLELQLRSLKSDSTFDLVCKVVHVCEDSGKWIFYVWDGTDTPAAEFQAISDAEAVQLPPLLEGPPLHREVLCTMPCVGTVLRIYSNRFIKEVLHMQKGIYWAKFCNITCKEEFGIWKGILLPTSRVRLLSHEDGSVVDRLKMYDSRNANKVHCQPMTGFPSNVTGVDVEYEKEGYSTLMESLTHDEVTHKAKTLVRVVGAFPCQPSVVRSLLSTGTYTMRLTLEDPTARIHALVHKDEMVKFFGGFLTAEAVIKKMNKLLGYPEPEDHEEGVPLTRNPPWIWCCLKSYYRDKSDIWGSRAYQIFATEIKD
ncbi:protection of telomeres protein 1b-like isoform X1 [Sorghum bicolor]|uniref:protection of telomeres protein 1b-like isoform X1 n=1 Tax=Sorghum bicolor TaxID=4558 RepID=UPI000B425155|nr:protection of telomeres protein 1b-like isoform X1 [Sorghum bicolor]|eukprot:XP_021318209.1 protection of telomeres protein 1b-like isoform X1 [Sorghum bicolor]